MVYIGWVNHDKGYHDLDAMTSVITVYITAYYHS